MRVDDVPGRLLARVREARGVAARARGDDVTFVNLERFEEVRSLMRKRSRWRGAFLEIMIDSRSS